MSNTYTLAQMTDYLSEKMDINQAIYIKIRKETNQTITLEFKPLDKGDIRRWTRPIPFPKLLKEQKDKLITAVAR